MYILEPFPFHEVLISLKARNSYLGGSMLVVLTIMTVMTTRTAVCFIPTWIFSVKVKV